MRLHFTSVDLPSKDSITRALGPDAPNMERFVSYLDAFYPYIKEITDIYGFDLLRMKYQEMMIIVHNPSYSRWIIEVRNYGK